MSKSRAVNTGIFFRFLVKYLKPDIVCDVGTLDASHSILLRHISRILRIIAFEANPCNHEHILARGIEKSANIELVHKAISNESAELVFNVQKYENACDQQWMAGTISYWLFISVKYLILDTEDPFHRAKRIIPVYMWLVGFMISMVTLVKGLKHVGIHLDLGMGGDFADAALASALVGLLVAGFGALLLRRIQEVPNEQNRFYSVERVFAVLMVFTACSMAFAHGSNDVANAVGPLAAVVSTVQSGGVISAKAAMPWWILMIGAVGIVAGLATYGWRVIATVGRKITELTPSRGFAAELGAAGTVVIASATGLPISTTHTLVGAVLGVGFARGIGALNTRIIGSIFMSWLITLPAGAGLAIIFFYIFKAIFGFE